MNISIVTHNYPTVDEPYLQPFIRDQLKVLMGLEGYSPYVLVPTPHTIPFTKRWQSNRSLLLDADLGFRFSYFSVPRRLAPAVTGKNLARNLVKNIKRSVDLFHVHWLYPNGIAIPEINGDYRFILNIHGTDWHSTKNDPRFSILIRKALYSAETIVVSGDEIKLEILERYPGLDVRVSYNFVNTDLFTLPDIQMQNAAKKSLHFNPEKTHILTVANIRPEKGIDLYLDAISHLDSSKICFHIIGQPASGAYAKTISSKIQKLNPDSVKLHSPVHRTKMPLFYHAADAYFLPSRSEGFNVSLLESLSTGLLTLSTRTGGAARVLNNERGILIEPENVSTIVEALEYLSEKESFNRSQKLRSYILENFSLQHYASFLDDLYTELSNRPLK